MLPAPRHQYRYDEYLALEETSAQKNEYYNGEIYAMAGATPQHAALSAELIALFASHLRGKPCRVYTADLRIRVRATGLATYPDLSVICGDLESDPDGRNTAINPSVLVEVLSDSTEAYDRGEKREHYQTIASLKDYLLVSQRERKVEHFRRNNDTWSMVAAVPGELLHVQAIDMSLDVRALYEQALD